MILPKEKLRANKKYIKQKIQLNKINRANK